MPKGDRASKQATGGETHEVSFEDPNIPPKPFHARQTPWKTQGLNKISLVLCSCKCHYLLFYTFLVNRKGVSTDSVPMLSKVSDSRRESSFTNPDNVSLFIKKFFFFFPFLPSSFILPSRTSCRYKFHNLSSGEASWDYPLQAVLSPGTLHKYFRVNN